MSIKLMTMVWDAAPVSGSELLCLLAMADWANDDGGSVHPSIRSVAEKVRVSEKQARRLVQGLVEAGYMSVVGNPYGGAPGTTKQWVINVKKLRALVEAKQRGDEQTAPPGVTPPMGVTPPTHVPDPSHPCPKTTPTHVPDPSHAWEPNHHRTINRTTKEPSKAHECALEGLADVDQQLVDDWKKVRLAKRAGPITATVVKGLTREAQKAGISLSEAIEICCANGWQGFRADWFSPNSRGGVVNKQMALEQRNKAAGDEWLRQQGIAA